MKCYYIEIYDSIILSTGLFIYGYSVQETLRFGRTPQNDGLGMCNRFAFNQFPESPPTRDVCGDHPPQDRLPTQKLVAKGLSVPSEERLSGPDAPDRASQGPPHDRRERIVQPRQGRRARPSQFLGQAVIPVENPSIRSGRFQDPFAEDMWLRCLPVRAPEELIEFYVRLVEQPGDLPRQCCLAGTARANHDGALQVRSCPCVGGHPPQVWVHGLLCPLSSDRTSGEQSIQHAIDGQCRPQD